MSATREAQRAVAAAEAAQSALGAFVTVTHDLAEEMAAASDADLRVGRRRGPLHGTPVALKDNIAVAGVPLTAGSRVLDGHVAERDAAVIHLLREAGAVIVGKTALDEFAFATVGEGITNPVRPDACVGGSSGGSAAAVAAGVCPLALGTDTGGSVRIPAACCDVVGFKPTYGTFPTKGVVTLSWTLDHIGLLTPDVEGASLAFAALTGAQEPARARADLAGARLGVPSTAFLASAWPEVVGAFDAALALLRAAGAEFVEVDLPDPDVGLNVQYLIVLAEAAAYHLDAHGGRDAGYGDGVWEAIEWGHGVGAGDYLVAQRARARLHEDLEALLADIDACVLPTMPIPPPAPGQGEVTLGDGRREDVVSGMLRYTCMFNHGGQPAISVPARPPGHGAFGFQAVTACGADLALLRLAGALERVLNPAADLLLSED